MKKFRISLTLFVLCLIDQTIDASTPTTFNNFCKKAAEYAQTRKETIVGLLQTILHPVSLKITSFWTGISVEKLTLLRQTLITSGVININDTDSPRLTRTEVINSIRALLGFSVSTGALTPEYLTKKAEVVSRNLKISVTTFRNYVKQLTFENTDKPYVTEKQLQSAQV
jgi:hypothetical protein